MSNTIITLAAAKKLRESRQPVSRGKLLRGITDAQLSALTRIPLTRIKVLESLNPNKAEEPWLDEAYCIAKTLGVPMIEMLIGGTTNLAELVADDDPHDALEVWRTGVRLPLRFGIRLGLIFGMEPLGLLDIPPIVWQLGRTTASGERTSGICPWCIQPVVGDAGHLPTCTLGNLYHSRTVDPSTLGVAPTPRKPGVRTQGSKSAPGLKRLRERLGVTQEVFAGSIGRHPAYYARLEQMHDPLNNQLAQHICAIYRVTMLDLYSA